MSASVHSSMTRVSQCTEQHDTCQSVYIATWHVSVSVQSSMTRVSQCTEQHDMCQSVYIATWHVPVSVQSSMTRVSQCTEQQDMCQCTQQEWSHTLLPVVSWMISALFWWNSVAVVKPIGTILLHSACKDIIKCEKL